MKRTYTVELRSGPVPALVDKGVDLDTFMSSLLEDRHLAGPAPSADRALLVFELRTGVDATSPLEALQIAATAFERAAKRARIADFDVVDASAWIDDGTEHDRRELLSGADVADRIGMSRQRIAQLVAEKGRFPRPAATFGTVSVWQWGDIVDWIAAGGRGEPNRLAAHAAVLGYQMTGPFTESPQAQEYLTRLIALANREDKVAIDFLEAHPELAFKDRDTWVQQVDSGRGPGLAVGGTRVVRTRR